MGRIVVFLLLSGCAAGPTPLRSFADLRYDAYRHERTIRSAHARVDLRIAELGTASEKPPLVLLHPWGTTMQIWRAVAPALAADRRVLLIDLPGHGKSGKPPGRYPPKRLAAGVLDAMQAAGIERAVVAGNSLGGATAIELAVRAPEHVVALILIGSPGGERVPEPLAKLVRNTATPANVGSINEQLVSAAWLFLAWGDYPVGERMRDDWLASRDASEWNDWARATSAALIDVLEWAPPIEQIHVPALVVHGTRDPVVLPERGETLARRLGARFELMDGCGHMPEVDCPVELLRRMQPFLALN